MLMMLTLFACFELDFDDISQDEDTGDEDAWDDEDEDEDAWDDEDEDEDEDGVAETDWDGTCDPADALPDSGAILAIGDSMFDWVGSCGDAPDLAGLLIGEKVHNEAVGGATMLEDIPGQYTAQGWEWVIVDGGGNDLECESESACRRILEEVAEETDRLFEEIVADGAQVVFVSYPNFGAESEVGELWAAMGEEFVSTMEAVADAHSAVSFVDLRTVMDGDEQPELFDEDGVHPSEQGAAVIAAEIAAVIRP